MAKMETLHWDAALQSWRKATQADPQFALAHIPDDAVARSFGAVCRTDKAFASRDGISREEQSKT
jgi:hypothetical protein